jgi:hypothetical protein
MPEVQVTDHDGAGRDWQERAATELRHALRDVDTTHAQIIQQALQKVNAGDCQGALEALDFFGSEYKDGQGVFTSEHLHRAWDTLSGNVPVPPLDPNNPQQESQPLYHQFVAPNAPNTQNPANPRTLVPNAPQQLPQQANQPVQNAPQTAPSAPQQPNQPVQPAKTGMAPNQPVAPQTATKPQPPNAQNKTGV